MAYQKVTTTSYGGRLKNALQGVGAGFIMLIAGTILLFWNEGRTVKTTRMLKEAQGVCVELGDIEQVNSEMNGKMVHASGFANTMDVLTDDQFDMSIIGVKLIRNAEYYQWVEHTKTETKDKVGGGQETITTYTYSKEWVSSPVNSSSFEDPSYRGIDNDILLNVEDKTWQAENVQFGAYTFPEGLISQMNNSKPMNVELKEEVVEYYEKEFHRTYSVSETDTFLHPNGNVLYIGLNPNSARVGDVRVTYEMVLPGDVSILAKVNGNTFDKYTAKNGYSLMTLEDGTVGMDEMFANEHAANKTTAWILRLIGILLIFFGFKNIFNIITQLLKVLPFLGNIANLGVNLVAGVLAFAWSLIVIAIAWLWYRPVLGIILLAAAGALIWFLGKKSKEKKAQLDAQAAAAPAAPAAPAQPVAPAQPAAPAQPVPPVQPAAPVPPAPAPAPDFSDAPAPDFSDAPAPDIDAQPE
ncbi:MAG: TMEM43 family protein [Bacteroidales bacterium]|nr:TMEM43 family protein [Bacteroidales bacterium]